MKREKSVLLIIAALAVVLISVVYTMRAPGAGKSNGVSQTNTSDDYSAEPESVIPAGDRMAHAAQIALYSCFDRDINEEPVYPKEYYGSYCADGKLIIYLSSLGGETLSRYNALFRSAGFSDLSFIVYKKRDYRKNITSIYGEDIFHRLIEAGYQADSLQVDEIAGKIDICVYSGAEESAREYVEHIVDYGIYSGLKPSDVRVTTGNWVPGDRYDFYSPSKEVMIAYSDLMAYFSESGAPSYPDEYCGCYGDEKMHICLTSLDEEVTARYDKVFANPDLISYELRSISKNTMLSYMYDMIDRMLKNGLTFYDYNFNETNGKIEFTVPKNSASKTGEFLYGLIRDGEYDGLDESDLVIGSE